MAGAEASLDGGVNGFDAAPVQILGGFGKLAVGHHHLFAGFGFARSYAAGALGVHPRLMDLSGHQFDIRQFHTRIITS